MNTHTDSQTIISKESCSCFLNLRSTAGDIYIELIVIQDPTTVRLLRLFNDSTRRLELVQRLRGLRTSCLSRLIHITRITSVGLTMRKVQFGNGGTQGIVTIGIFQQGNNGMQTLEHSQGGRPIILYHIQTNAAIATNVAMENGGTKCNTGRFEGIIGRKPNIQDKDTFFEGSSVRTFQKDGPLMQLRKFCKIMQQC